MLDLSTEPTIPTHSATPTAADVAIAKRRRSGRRHPHKLTITNETTIADLHHLIGGEAVLAACVLRAAVQDLRRGDPAARAYFAGSNWRSLCDGLGLDPTAFAARLATIKPQN